MVAFHQNERLAATAFDTLSQQHPDLVPLACDLRDHHVKDQDKPNHAYLHAGLTLLTSPDSADAIQAISRMAKISPTQARGLLVACVDQAKNVLEPHADLLAQKGLVRIKGHYIPVSHELQEDSRFIRTLPRIDAYLRPIAEEAFLAFQKLTRRSPHPAGARMLGYIAVQLTAPGLERTASFNSLSMENGPVAHAKLLQQSSRSILKAADRLSIIIPANHLDRGPAPKPSFRSWTPYSLNNQLDLGPSDRNFHKPRTVRP